MALFFVTFTNADKAPYRVAPFSVDVTIPLGHRCMGVLPMKASEIVDPLFAKGWVWLGAGEPIVLVAVDWCEIRNGAYDYWRVALAESVGTRPERVLVHSLHQHDAPVVDLGAEKLLAGVELAGELCDTEFHERIVHRVADAVRDSLTQSVPVTHIGIGQSKVLGIASNRRVVLNGNRVSFNRGSSSGRDPEMRNAPDGLIDPWLKTISFWSGNVPVVAMHAYATHPMSYYGKGGVSADFVGIARKQFQAEHPEALQIYVTGCSGDVTAGKYNDGSSGNRQVLSERLVQAMRRSWEKTERTPVGKLKFRTAPLMLDFISDDDFSAEILNQRLVEADSVPDRILAAMALSSRARIARGKPIDVPCLDWGNAQLVLFPGEAFVGYQWMAQRMRSDSFVMCLGYGECWPGYIPTRSAFDDGFGTSWRWVDPGAEERIRSILWEILPSGESDPEFAGEQSEVIVRDVFPASENHPRNSEGSIIALGDKSLLFAATEFVQGKSDYASAHIISRRSENGGLTWGEGRILQENVGNLNVMSASLKRFHSLGNSGIGLFYLVKNSFDDLKVYLRISTDETETFGKPICVTDAPGYHVMINDRVVQLLDGRLICPVSWSPDVRNDNHFVSFCYFSDDGGQSWKSSVNRVDLPRRGAMEPGVLERKDGSLLMMVRTQFGEIYVSTSTDRGLTWDSAKPWGVKSPEAPATLRRIPSTGDLLLIWNPEVKSGAGHGGLRTPLATAVSRNDGLTWGNRRFLEKRTDQTYAYTSVMFQGDRVALSYYVRDEASGQITCRFRSLPVRWFYDREM